MGSGADYTVTEGGSVTTFDPSKHLSHGPCLLLC